MRLDHLLSKEIIFSLCHVSSCWWRVAIFCFWVEHLLVRSLKWWSARACDDFKRLCFPFCVGWLLVRCWVSGMTHVVVPVYRLLRAAGRLLLWWFVCGVWVLCENWIVDASILFFCKFDFVKQFFCL